MKRILAHSVAVGFAVAATARAAESIATFFTPTNHSLHDYVGASVAFLTASALFYAWRSSEARRLVLFYEREKIRGHVHHHIRNALNTIIMKYHEDDMVRESVDRIIRELESVLPANMAIRKNAK